MKYRLLIRPEAEADIEESFNWYEGECPGLGHEFRRALGAAILRIRSSPLSFSIVHRQIRRTLVNRFPHAFFYFVSDETIVITACMHHKRDPKIWKER